MNQPKSEWWHYFPRIEFSLVYEAFYEKCATLYYKEKLEIYFLENVFPVNHFFAIITFNLLIILVLRISPKLKLPCLKTLILLGIFSFLAFLFVLDFLSRFRLALKQLVPLQGLAVNNWTQSFKFQIVSTGVYKENGLQKRETWWSSSSPLYQQADPHLGSALGALIICFSKEVCFSLQVCRLVQQWKRAAKVGKHRFWRKKYRSPSSEARHVLHSRRDGLDVPGKHRLRGTGGWDCEQRRQRRVCHSFKSHIKKQHKESYIDNITHEIPFVISTI